MIIIWQNSEQHERFYQYMISSKIESDVLIAHSFDEFTQANQKCELLIFDCKIKLAFANIKKVIELNPNLPIIITGEIENLDIVKAKMGHNPLIHYFGHGQNYEIFLDLIDKSLKQSVRIKEISDIHYSKIAIEFFYSCKKLKSDVYIKLSEKKFVKIFHRFQEITQTDLSKLETKGTHFLYVKEKDFSPLMDELIEHINELKNENIKNFDETKFIAECQKSVHEIVCHVGIDEVSIKMADYAINSTIQTINENHSLKDMWKKVVKHENYIAEHSMLLSYISTCICDHTPWKSQSNNAKLCLASFFHDMSLPIDELATIHDIKSPYFQSLRRKEKDAIINHPIASSKLLDEIDGIPGDVSKIVLCHHEKFDGSGFPKGIDYKHIPPLSAIFICAVEITHFLHEYGPNKDDMEHFLNNFLNEYKKEIPKQVQDAIIHFFKLEEIKIDNVA